MCEYHHSVAILKRLVSGENIAYALLCAPYICIMERDYELQQLGEIAHLLLQFRESHRVWAFEGEMGAGKTTLIHAVCDQLGLEGSFGSPTFSIINEYRAAGSTIYHIDLYRCKNEDEAIRAGVEDALYSGNLCLVEWPSKAPGIFPEDTLRIMITVKGESHRAVSIDGYSTIDA